MKVEFLQDFAATTTAGTRTIAAGTVLDLADDKAAKLLAAGVVKVAETVPYNPLALPYLDHHGRLVVPFDCPPRYRYWAGGQSIRETLQELFQERAAIMEYDGGLPKEKAEEEAAKIVSKYIKEQS